MTERAPASRVLPFSAVVGQEEAKLALILATVDRSIGGVLLRGEKGSAKSSLARGLAALLPGGAPFVELPIGATEDRVVGTLDITAALTGGEVRFAPGLLAAADGGVLYVDEVNLLPDHLVDVLLDAAASGVGRVERESVSHTHPARFVLIGSMNPEEGELRPQLLDRFGLAVEVVAPADPSMRASAVRRRLAFDSDAAGVAASFEAEEALLGDRLACARSAALPEDLVVAVSALCASVGAEGLRADLTICRAAAALAGWEGRDKAGPEDVRRVAGMALAHRARRDPFEPSGVDLERLEQAMDEALGGGNDPGEQQPVDPDSAQSAPIGGSGGGQLRRASSGRGAASIGTRGRQVGARAPDGPIGAVAIGATVRAAAERRSNGGASDALVEPGDLREAVREQRTANLVVIAVDASGSMGAAERMEAAKGAVVGLLAEAYVRRDLVALVSFRGDGADVLLRPTGSVEVAKARLAALPTGGRTPLGAGLLAALDLASTPARADTHVPRIVVITDGRATSDPGGGDPPAAAMAAADAVRKSGVDALVVDVEGTGRSNSSRLGLARELAARMGARHCQIEELTPAAVRSAIGI